MFLSFFYPQVVEKDLKMIAEARVEVKSQANRMLEQGMESQVL